MEKETRHYLILSRGAYSEYSPEYFVGDKEITQKKFDKKAREIGDLCLAEFEALPEREHKHTSQWCCSFGRHETTEKFDPQTGKKVYSPFDDKWWKRMNEFIAEQGFTPLPDNIPEINIAYSDYPTSN